MIVARSTMAGRSGVPAGACELAARLSALFERDVEIVERLSRWGRRGRQRGGERVVWRRGRRNW